MSKLKGWEADLMAFSSPPHPSSITLFFLGFTYWFVLDRTQYLNHFYLICLVSFLMIFIPAHWMYALDAYWRPSIRAVFTPSLCDCGCRPGPLFL